MRRRRSSYLGLLAITALLLVHLDARAQPVPTAQPQKPPAQPSALPAAAGATAPKPASQPVGPRLRIVVTGKTGGLGSVSSSAGDLMLLLYEELAARGGAARVTGSVYGLNDGSIRFGAYGDLARGVELLKTKGKLKRRVIAQRVDALESSRSIAIQYPPDPHLDLLTLIRQRNRQTLKVPRLRRVTLRLVEFSVGKKRARFFERREAADRKLKRDPLGWDAAWLIRGEGRLARRSATFSLLLKNYATGPQRIRRVGALAKGKANTLLVGAGDQVATRSTRTGRRSTTRRLDFLTLSKLGYHAYCPSSAELYYGLKDLQKYLKQSPLPMVATNLVFGKGKQKGKTVFARYLLRQIAGLRVALIGFVDPQLAREVHSRELVGDLEVRDPATEAAAVLEELGRLPAGRPDLVVALGVLSPAVRAKLLGFADIDLLLGNFSAGGRRRGDVVVDLAQSYQHQSTDRGVGYISQLNHALVGEFALKFAPVNRRWRLSHVIAKHHFIDDTLPHDEALRRQIMKRTLAAWGAYHREIMPPVETIIGTDDAVRSQLRQDPTITKWLPANKTEKWQLWMTPGLFATMVANLLLEGTRSEVAIVMRRRRLNVNIPGPILEGYVRQWLGKSETVRRYDLDGKRLRQLWLALRRNTARFAVSGLATTGAGHVANGRLISDKEIYQVAMTRTVAEMDSVAEVLRGTKPEERFRSETHGARLVPNAKGKQVLLRELVVARLNSLREGLGKENPAYLTRLRKMLTARGKAISPRWTLSADNISLSVSSRTNHPSGAWTRNPGTRETRTVTPGNYAIGASGKVVLTYDSANLAWETSAMMKMMHAVTDLTAKQGGTRITTEPHDDLVGSTELRLKFIELAVDRRRHIRIVPYTQVLYDTELTATEGAPHQRQLRVGAGLVSYPGSVLQEVRLGGLFKTDFDREQGQAEGGLLAGAKIAFPIYRAEFSLEGILRYYLPNDDDTAEDLGLIVESIARLKVPFTRSLSLSLFADLYLYEHKVAKVVVDKTDLVRGTGINLHIGAALTFDHIAKLF